MTVFNYYKKRYKSRICSLKYNERINFLKFLQREHTVMIMPDMILPEKSGAKNPVTAIFSADINISIFHIQ